MSSARGERVSKVPDLTLDAGLPASIDAERVLLAAVLLDNDAFAHIGETIKADDFAYESHRRIFLRMTDLMDSGRAVDIVTLVNELSRHKEIETVGGVAFIAGITEGIPRRPVIEEYARIVRDKAQLRRLMGICSAAIARAADQQEDAADVVGEVSEQIQQVAEQGILSPLETFGDFVGYTYPTVDDVFRHSARSLGLPSGIKELDRLTYGFQRKDVIVVAARPSLGKTAVAVSFAKKAAVELDQTVALFSLEMSKKKIFHRLLSACSSVSLNDIMEGRWTETNRRYAIDAMNQIAGAPLYVDDQKGMTVQRMQAKASRLKTVTGHLDLVIVDQLNHVVPPKSAEKYRERRNEVGAIMRALGEMADHLDVPLVVLHQLSRENEKRDDKRPRLSDLRESGDVEQDADVVIFPHRDSYYAKSSDEIENRKAEMIVAKQRQGPTGTAHCEFLADRGLWQDKEERASLW